MTKKYSNKTIARVIPLAFALLTAFALTACQGVISAAETESAATVTKTETDSGSGPARTLTVSGNGSVSVAPDIAYVSLGVQTMMSDASEAQSENALVMNAVIAAVRALGVAEDDIATNGFGMYPSYDYSDPNRPVINGYNVSNNVTATVRDVTKVAAVLDGGLKAGANSMGGIQFDVSDQTKYYDMAVKAALDNAEQKAGLMSEHMGVTIGLPVEVTENRLDYYPVTFKSMANRVETSSDTATPIQAGDLEINAIVNVVYSY